MTLPCQKHEALIAVAQCIKDMVDASGFGDIITKKNAEKLVAQLKAAGFDAIIK